MMIKTATEAVEDFNQSNKNSETKTGRHSTHKSKIRRVLKEKTGKHSDSWPAN